MPFNTAGRARLGGNTHLHDCRLLPDVRASSEVLHHLLDLLELLDLDRLRLLPDVHASSKALDRLGDLLDRTRNREVQEVARTLVVTIAVAVRADHIGR